MSNAIQNQSNVSTAPDFTALISALNQVSQALLDYGQAGKISNQDQVEPHCDAGLDVPISSVLTPPLSNRAKRIKRYKECGYEPKDTTAFVDKDIAKFFEKAYNNGNFHDEVRYYYIPAHIVRQEYKLLKEHQHKDILSLFFDVYNELNLKSKLIACIDKDKSLQDISFAQLGESMFSSLKLLNIIHAHLNNFKLVHKTMLPKHRT